MKREAVVSKHLHLELSLRIAWAIVCEGEVKNGEEKVANEAEQLPT